MKGYKRYFLAVFIALVATASLRTLHQAPVLMYHRVALPSAPGEEGLCVSPESFERQMEFLKVHRYNVVPLSALIEMEKQGRNPPPKTVVITFDDGTADNLENAFPVLRKMGFPATIFMITNNIGKEGWLSEEDLRLLDAGGIDIGSHTLSHAFLPNTDKETALAEIRDSKKRLEEILGRPVTTFSYPAGGVTAAVREMVRSEGYAGAVTTNYGRKQGPWALHRIKIKDAGGNLFSFWGKLSGLYHIGKKRIPVE